MPTSRRATKPEPEVLDAGLPDEELLVTQDAGQLATFTRGLATFLQTARALEVSAKTTLTTARTLRLPTNADEDAAIQRFIKKATLDRKAVEEHWTITAVVSRFHKALTGARGRAVKALQEAGEIANRHHQAYRDAEERRVREENERRRREAEEQARKDREAELARLEEEALKAEANDPEMSKRERVFVEHVAAGTDPTIAARYAGYQDPAKQAARLLTFTKIQDALKARREAKAIREQAAAVAEKPIEVQVEHVEADVEKVGTDRTTWSYEITDEAAFIEAAISGRYGIPRDVLTFNPKAMTRYARDMRTLLDRWPGVRAVKNTKLV